MPKSISHYLAFSATQVGYNHVKSNKVCEDSSGYLTDENMLICVVADGHGSDNYPRTDRGSRFAVISSKKCIEAFVNKVQEANPKSNDSIDLLSDERKGYPILQQLAKSILKDWYEAVYDDYKDNPFTDEELKNVSEKYKKRYLSNNGEEKTIEKAYGCTLIVYVITDEYSFGMQIGDGKCVVVTDDGDFTEPIPWDDDCQLNVTTSICDSDAIEEFRFFVTDKQPVAVFCGSDGIDDSYSNMDEVYGLYRSMIKIFIDHGADVGKSEIEEYLPVLTKKGSGDDVSVGLLLDVERARNLSSKFETQTELFNLRRDIKSKKQELTSIIERNKAKYIKTRIKVESQITDPQSGTDGINESNDLNETIDILEKEIKSMEERVLELEKNPEAPVNCDNECDKERNEVKEACDDEASLNSEEYGDPTSVLGENKDEACPKDDNISNEQAETDENSIGSDKERDDIIKNVEGQEA